MAARKKKPTEVVTVAMEVCYIHDALHPCCGLVVAVKPVGSIWSKLERDGPTLCVREFAIGVEAATAIAQGERHRVAGDTAKAWPEPERRRAL